MDLLSAGGVIGFLVTLAVVAVPVAVVALNIYLFFAFIRMRHDIEAIRDAAELQVILLERATGQQPQQ